jgi:2-succinyl-6-hydroxy-2,4-cyclohexadiene-1-carboxylate synthase
VIAFLHGMTGAPSSWDDVAALVGGGVAEPILGHAPGLCRESTFAAEIERLIARLAPLAPVHLVGYSMGARLALGLLAGAPGLFSRATLIGVHPGLAEPGERAERIAADERWARLLETEGIAAFVAAWEAQPLFATQAQLPAEVRERHRRRRLAHDPRGLAAAFRALGLGAMPDLWPALPALAMPVTFVAGEIDRKFRAIATRAVARASRADIRLVPGAGHDVVLEAPRAVAAALLEDP